MARISSFIALALGLCLAMPARGQVPVAIPTALPAAATEQVQHTVDRAIGYLQTESAAWLNTRKCAACHHVPMPLWALGEAKRQGYTIDEEFVADTTESLLGSRDKLMASKIFPNPADPPDPRPQGRGLNMGLPFLAVAAQSMTSLKEGQKQSLKLIAEEIVNKQQPDGSWEFFATLRRPPINESQTTDAAWIILALQGEMGPDSPESQRVALSKAITWLDAAKLADIHQDKVLKVLRGARSAKPRKAMMVQTASVVWISLIGGRLRVSNHSHEPSGCCFLTISSAISFRLCFCPSLREGDDRAATARNGSPMFSPRP